MSIEEKVSRGARLDHGTVCSDASTLHSAHRSFLHTYLPPQPSHPPERLQLVSWGIPPDQPCPLNLEHLQGSQAQPQAQRSGATPLGLHGSPPARLP